MPDRGDRPNVLLVCTDQQTADALGCAGTAGVDTPAADRLAEEGTRFANAYCTFPLCTPSRASLFTGRMPHEVGVAGNRVGIDDAYREEELGRLFDAAGYDAAYAGKWHLPESGISDGHGFSRLCGLDDERVADACVEFLETDRDDPFLLVASFDDPHNICEWARNQPLPWGSVDDVPLEQCPNLPRNFAPPPYEPAVVREEARTDDRKRIEGAMLDADEDEWRRYRHAYYRLVERVDARVGRVLDALDRTGRADDTVVVFTSDHGDSVGAHRLNQKSWLYEEQTNVPLVVRAPGETGGGRVDRRLVSNGLDLLPTLCDYAGVDPPADLRGHSLRAPAAGDPVENWRDALVVQTEVPVAGRMVRTDRYKYAVYARGRDREQLFDLERDPEELVDRSVEADYADVLDAHRERLLAWCAETDDRFAEHGTHPGLPSIPGYDYAEVAAYFERRDA